MQSDLVTRSDGRQSVTDYIISSYRLIWRLALPTICSSCEPIGNLAPSGSNSVKVTRTMRQITIRKIRSQFVVGSSFMTALSASSSALFVRLLLACVTQISPILLLSCYFPQIAMICAIYLPFYIPSGAPRAPVNPDGPESVQTLRQSALDSGVFEWVTVGCRHGISTLESWDFP
jgi:hypothetical protein